MNILIVEVLRNISIEASIDRSPGHSPYPPPPPSVQKKKTKNKLYIYIFLLIARRPSWNFYGFFLQKNYTLLVYCTMVHKSINKYLVVGVAAASSELFAAPAASAIASPPEPASTSVVASASVHAAQASVLPGGCRA
jgi:hypothetical protein